jgi:hypothetical protein
MAHHTASLDVSQTAFDFFPDMQLVLQISPGGIVWEALDDIQRSLFDAQFWSRCSSHAVKMPDFAPFGNAAF